MQDMSYIGKLTDEDLYKIVYTSWKHQKNDFCWYHVVNELCNRDVKFRENYTKHSQENIAIDKMMSCLNI